MKYKSFNLILFLSFVLLFTSLHKAEAVVPVAVPFGGPILMTYECTCSGGWFMLTYDQMTKLPIPMVFQFGQSMIHLNYNIFTPAVQTVGTYVPGGVCLLASLDCGGFAVQGTVSPLPMPGIGTSLK